MLNFGGPNVQINGTSIHCQLNKNNVTFSVKLLYSLHSLCYLLPVAGLTCPQLSVLFVKFKLHVTTLAVLVASVLDPRVHTAL